MGLEFGHLQRVVGITYFQISPHEQKALCGVLNPGFRNTLRRTRNSFFWVTIPILSFITLVKVSTDMNHKSKRKNPADYEHEV